MTCPVQWNDSCETQIGNPKSFPFASGICINDCKLFFQRSSQKLAVSTLVCNFQPVLYYLFLYIGVILLVFKTSGNIPDAIPML